jgi:VWFA-related protein
MSGHGSFKRHLTAAILLYGTLLSATAWSQAKGGAETAPANTLRVKAQLVVVDVTVTDASGNAVTNLTKDDFEIYESGVKQTIRSFEPPSAHTLPAAVASGSDMSLRHLQQTAPETPVTVLVMDELNTKYMDQVYSRTSIKRYLNSQPETLLQPTALFAVTEASLKQVNDFTLNRASLLDALQQHKPAYPFQMMRTGTSAEGTAERFAESLATLQQVAQAMSGFPGRKNIVWVGQGFPSIDMRNLPDTQQKLLRGAGERTINMMNDAHATLYTIDPQMATSGADDFTATSGDEMLSEAHNAKNPFDGTISFNTFAPETGGRAFSLGNDIDHQIRASVEQGTTFYTLSYSPQMNVSEAEQEYRRLTVRCLRPGLHVMTRRGYFSAPPPPPAVSPKQLKKELSFDLGAAAVSKMSYTAIGLLASPAEQPGAFILQVDSSSMSWQTAEDGEHRSELLLLTVALDKNDKPIAKSASSVTARMPADRALSSVPFATLQAQLNIPANATRVRFIVRDMSSGRIGSADLLPDTH